MYFPQDERFVEPKPGKLMHRSMSPNKERFDTTMEIRHGLFVKGRSEPIEVFLEYANPTTDFVRFPRNPSPLGLKIESGANSPISPGESTTSSLNGVRRRPQSAKGPRFGTASRDQPVLLTNSDAVVHTASVSHAWPAPSYAGIDEIEKALKATKENSPAVTLKGKFESPNYWPSPGPGEYFSRDSWSWIRKSHNKKIFQPKIDNQRPSSATGRLPSSRSSSPGSSPARDDHHNHVDRRASSAPKPRSSSAGTHSPTDAPSPSRPPRGDKSRGRNHDERTSPSPSTVPQPHRRASSPVTSSASTLQPQTQEVTVTEVVTAKYRELIAEYDATSKEERNLIDQVKAIAARYRSLRGEPGSPEQTGTSTPPNLPATAPAPTQATHTDANSESSGSTEVISNDEFSEEPRHDADIIRSSDSSPLDYEAPTPRDVSDAMASMAMAPTLQKSPLTPEQPLVSKTADERISVITDDVPEKVLSTKSRAAGGGGGSAAPSSEGSSARSTYSGPAPSPDKVLSEKSLKTPPRSAIPVARPVEKASALSPTPLTRPSSSPAGKSKPTSILRSNPQHSKLGSAGASDSIHTGNDLASERSVSATTSSVHSDSNNSKGVATAPVVKSKAGVTASSEKAISRVGSRKSLSPQKEAKPVPPPFLRFDAVFSYYSYPSSPVNVLIALANCLREQGINETATWKDVLEHLYKEVHGHYSIHQKNPAIKLLCDGYVKEAKSTLVEDHMNLKNFTQNSITHVDFKIFSSIFGCNIVTIKSDAQGFNLIDYYGDQDPASARFSIICVDIVPYSTRRVYTSMCLNTSIRSDVNERLREKLHQIFMSP